jgi:hypothetical protein
MSWLTPEWVEAGAVVVAAFAAWRGFGAWRYELVGKKRYELAEETLALFYEAQEVIREMRVGIVDSGEVSNDDPENPAVAWFNAIEAERRALFARLAALKFRFMATFGSEYGKAFQTFARVNGKVRHVARRLPELDPSGKAYQQFDSIRYHQGKDDEIEKELATALAPIEDLCRNIVTVKGPWERWREWTKPPDE